MSLKLKFDLQFFGLGGSSTQQVRKRDPEPDELKNLRLGLYDAVYPGLQSFDANSWKQAQRITDNALQQQENLLSQLPNQLTNNENILNEMLGVTRTGNIPTALTDNMNSAVNKELQGSMGSMLNGLGNRGVLNSSITSKGISNLGQQAADAYNKNYLAAYNAVLGGYGQALQGAQNNTGALLSGLSALGNMPSQAYEGVYAGITPAFNLWKAWQNSYDTREDYDTIVTQKSSSCITGDTLVTLSNGEKIPVSELKENDKIKAWDFYNGCVADVPLTAFFKGNDKEFDIIRIEFNDGSKVGIIFEHLFFDMTLGKFVAINSDSEEYLGHYFAKVDNEGKIIPVKVNKIYKDGKTTKTYAPQSKGHLNFLADGFISGNDGQLGVCNMFEFDLDKMTYDKKKARADLKKYEKLKYKEFEDVMSKEFFDDNHIAEWSVAVGKGLVTLEFLKGYFAEFAHCFLK